MGQQTGYQQIQEQTIPLEQIIADPRKKTFELASSLTIPDYIIALIQIRTIQ
jgi:hypothetical protein